MTCGAPWPDGPIEKLKELYLDPSRITKPVIVTRLNLACGTTYTLKAVDAKIRKLGIINRLDPEVWAEPRVRLLRELYHRPDAPSYSVMARIINEETGAKFSRCAVSSKIQQMGFPTRNLPKGRTMAAYAMGQRAAPAAAKPRPAAISAEAVKLRCVEIEPRHLSLCDLDPGDCRYPYGGDRANEAITFCGHPAMPDRPYCAPHFHLCRGPGTVSERIATRGIGRAA